MRSLRTSIILLVAAGATSTWAGAQTLQFEALSNVTTFAADAASGMSMTTSTPAGVIARPFYQQASSGPAVPQDAASWVRVTGGPQNMAVESQSTITTSQPPALALVEPIDGLIRVQLNPPNFARIQFDVTVVTDATATASLLIDAFDDGTPEIDIQAGFNHESVSIDVPRDAAEVSIRFQSSTFAIAQGPGAPEYARARVTTSVRLIRSVCDVTVISTEVCGIGAGAILLPTHEFDGTLTYTALDLALFQSVYFLVLGFQQAPTPLPFPLVSGTCQLVPTPDIVVPFPTGVGPTPSVSISLRNLPSPFTFYTQGLGIDPATAVVQLGGVAQVDC